MTRLLLLCLVLISASADATTFFVNVGGTQNQFSPQTVTIQIGDTVTFINKGGFHNAQADDGSFTCSHGCKGDGMGDTGAPTNSNWLSSVTFTKPGTVGYFCLTHGAPHTGMFGTILVQGQVTPPQTILPAPLGDWRTLLVLAGLLVIAAAGIIRRRIAMLARQTPRNPR